MRSADRCRGSSHQIAPACLRSSKYLTQCRDGVEGLGLFKTRPLHAHDEMVHAEQCVIAGNLVFDEGFVADDEAIFDELLERLCKRLCALGLLVEAPG